MDQIKKLLETNQFPQYSLQEVLESYNHIELTEDETTEAMIWAKRKKEDSQKSMMQKLKEEENRKKLTQQTNYELVSGLMKYRAEKKFEGKFVLDENNKLVYDMLCCYFGQDDNFNSLCKSIGINNSSLDKGIFLAGNFGVGKTWLMKLFQVNQRQCFSIKNAKDISDDFQEDGEDGMKDYIKLTEAAFQDPSCFYQKKIGMCIDDLGTEDIKNHYGNKKNVIGDIIEKRYSQNSIGIYLHATTNLTSVQLNEFYGGRVVSRMREIFNFIELKGDDRRV